MRKHDISGNEQPAGVSMPRSQPPATPPNFISRKQLFPLFETQVPGATLVVAPTGYGKTALVSEWVQSNQRPTIWYTVDSNDSFNDFKTHLENSIQSFIPELDSLKTRFHNLDTSASIFELVNIVAKFPGEINFVIDFGSERHEGLLPFRQLLVDSAPENIHMVIIRRSTSEASLSRYAALGNLSLITSEDLKFSHSEVETIAEIGRVDLTLNGNAKELEQCSGWPAAVQLMCRNIGKNNAHIKFTDAMVIGLHPIAILASETLNVLSPESRETLLQLSIVEEFDLEIAKTILQDKYTESYLNKLATDGLFVTTSSTVLRSFRFNSIIYEALNKIREDGPELFTRAREDLVDLYISRNEISKALEHSFLINDKSKFTALLLANLREMAPIGRGDLMIKWSAYAGDESPYGEVMKKSIKVVGNLINLEFTKAEGLASELEFIASHGAGSEFLDRLTAMVRSHVYFARGDFENSRLKIKAALMPTHDATSFQNIDQIALLRIAASTAFLHDEFESLWRIYEQAQTLSAECDATVVAYHLTCMKALVLYSQGHYFQAAEVAGTACVQSKEFSFVGIYAPLDAMLVLARCQLEASELAKAVVIFRSIMDLAESYQIWPWYFMAQGSITRIEVTQGSFSKAADEISYQRKFLKSLMNSNNLSWMIDMSESFLFLYVGDFVRAHEIIQRMPRLEMVVQIELSHAFEKSPRNAAELVDALPKRTPREKITQLLAVTILNSDHQNLALKSLIEALELGAECGYREYFLRQHKLYSLVVKASKERPTFYLEELVQIMGQRLHGTKNAAGTLDEPLTKREIEILKHLTTGNPITSIAKSLHISQNTMKTHLRNTYRKLDADGRHSAVEKAKKLLLI
jgi:ATP/maltotriose-dependent transcriptional regulator MalT